MTNEIKCLMCGTCCTAFDISEIGKKAGERCSHLSPENMCTIYENRPWGCRGYRPDELCVLVSTLDDEQKVRVFRKIYDV
jgi:Fe-S-cluster containining protein